eukprot:5211832-Alexandrium_andersonii.AAC.1
MPSGDVIRRDPAAVEDVAAADALLANELAPRAADPGAVPGSPADGADVLALAVVVLAKAGLGPPAHVSGVIDLADQEGGPEPIVGDLARVDVLLSWLVDAHQVAETVAFVPGHAVVDGHPKPVPVPGGNQRGEVLVAGHRLEVPGGRKILLGRSAPPIGHRVASRRAHVDPEVGAELLAGHERGGPMPRGAAGGPPGRLPAP